APARFVRNVTCENLTPPLLAPDRALTLGDALEAPVLSAVRQNSIVSGRAALVFSDYALTNELETLALNAIHMFGVIAPWAIARANLRETAALRIHDRAGFRSGALIQIVRNTITIGIWHKTAD